MWGKVLGALCGATLALLVWWSPWLMVGLGAVGAMLGHLIDRRPAPPSATGPAALGLELELELELVQRLCPLFVELARVDGPAERVKIREMRHYFEQNLSAAAMQAVPRALKRALAAPTAEARHLGEQARAWLKPSLRPEVVECLYAIGLSDGPLQRAELEFIKQVVATLHLSDEQLEAITSRALGPQQRDTAYRTLGVAPDADEDVIKSAYRRLALKHHPDRSLDGGERFRQVKDAYETIKVLRGW